MNSPNPISGSICGVPVGHPEYPKVVRDIIERESVVYRAEADRIGLERERHYVENYDKLKNLRRCFSLRLCDAIFLNTSPSFA